MLGDYTLSGLALASEYLVINLVAGRIIKKLQGMRCSQDNRWFSVKQRLLQSRNGHLRTHQPQSSCGGDPHLGLAILQSRLRHFQSFRVTWEKSQCAYRLGPLPGALLIDANP